MREVLENAYNPCHEFVPHDEDNELLARHTHPILWINGVGWKGSFKLNPCWCMVLVVRRVRHVDCLSFLHLHPWCLEVACCLSFMSTWHPIWWSIIDSLQVSCSSISWCGFVSLFNFLVSVIKFWLWFLRKTNYSSLLAITFLTSFCIFYTNLWSSKITTFEIF